MVEEVGGPATPGFGFAIGLERLVMLLEGIHYDFPKRHQLDAYIVTIGDEVNSEALKLANVLRKQGLIVEREFIGRKPGKQFKTADKLNAKTVFTLGTQELQNRTVNMKLLSTGKEISLNLEEIYADNFKNEYSKILKKLEGED